MYIKKKHVLGFNSIQHDFIDGNERENFVVFWYYFFFFIFFITLHIGSPDVIRYVCCLGIFIYIFFYQHFWFIVRKFGWLIWVWYVCLCIIIIFFRAARITSMANCMFWLYALFLQFNFGFNKWIGFFC